MVRDSAVTLHYRHRLWLPLHLILLVFFLLQRVCIVITELCLKLKTVRASPRTLFSAALVHISSPPPSHQNAEKLFDPISVQTCRLQLPLHLASLSFFVIQVASIIPESANISHNESSTKENQKGGKRGTTESQEAH